MGVVGLEESTKSKEEEKEISLGSLAELTGFPVDYIKRELLLSDDTSHLDVEGLRKKVLTYLESF